MFLIPSIDLLLSPNVLTGAPVTDLHTLWLFSVWQQSATARAGASRFRPKNHPPRTTTTGTTAVDTEHPSISGGSGTASEASTKVAGWDGGSRSPSRLIVPSGVDVGRGVPRPGLWMADVTGMTEALQSPAKGWYTQHDQWSEPPLGAYAQQRYQQLRQYTSDLDGMRQAVLERSTTTKQAQPQPQQRPQRSTTQRSSAPAQPTLSHRDISPRLPSSPSPPFPQGPHTDAVWPDNRDQILDRIDDTQAQINELIAQPGLPAQLAHASHATAGQRNDDATTRQLDDKFMLGLLHREIREIRAMVSNLVDHSQYTRDTCTKLDERTTRMDARLGGLESNFSDFRAEMHQKLESMSESSKKEQVELLSSSLSPPTTDHPTLPSLREWSQRVTTATGGSDTDRATAPSEPVQPEERRHEQAVQSQSSPRRPAMVEPLSSGPHSVGSQHLSSPTRSGTSRFRRRQTALPQPLPPSDAPTVPSSASHYAQVTTTTHQATDHAGDSMAGDDVSGTMLSELELSRTVDTGHDTDHRGVVDPPATQKSTTTTTTHVVDHSHDPKKCVPCTRARRLERKRQARLAAAAAERQRKEDERIATHALVEQLQTVLDNQGTEAGKTWVLTLDRTDQELLLSLHARRLDDFYHQRTIWSGLTDEVRNFEATDVMHSLTSKHMKEAFHLFELYADQIDVLTLILPTAPTAPTASTTAAAPRVNGL